MNLSPAFGAIQNIANCLLTQGKYAEIASAMFCRCQVLTINSYLINNGPIFAWNGMYFVLTLFQTSAAYFTSKWTCSSCNIILFFLFSSWETGLLFYRYCACVNSHYCENCLNFKFIMKWLFIYIPPTIFFYFLLNCSRNSLCHKVLVCIYFPKATVTKNIPLGREVNTSCLFLVSVTPA